MPVRETIITTVTTCKIVTTHTRKHTVDYIDGQSVVTMKDESSEDVSKTEVTKYTIDGIYYTVTRTKDGSVVDAPCKCLGTNSTHSTTQCPWEKKRNG